MKRSRTGELCKVTESYNIFKTPEGEEVYVPKGPPIDIGERAFLSRVQRNSRGYFAHRYQPIRPPILNAKNYWKQIPQQDWKGKDSAIIYEHFKEDSFISSLVVGTVELMDNFNETLRDYGIHVQDIKYLKNCTGVTNWVGSWVFYVNHIFRNYVPRIKERFPQTLILPFRDLSTLISPPRRYRKIKEETEGLLEAICDELTKDDGPAQN